jgi:hypothetical protein
MSVIRFCITVCTVLLFSSCFNNQESKEDSDKKVVSIANPPSQLAQIMRDMDSRLDEIKSSAKESENWPSLDFDFPFIPDQEATDEGMLTEEVYAYSLAFKEIISKYNMEPSREGFDAIVQGCLACHYKSCPGPLVRIEKHIFQD